MTLPHIGVITKMFSALENKNVNVVKQHKEAQKHKKQTIVSKQVVEKYSEETVIL